MYWIVKTFGGVPGPDLDREIQNFLDLQPDAAIVHLQIVASPATNGEVCVVMVEQCQMADPRTADVPDS